MSNTTMQAIHARDYGEPEVLVLKQTPRPEPNADQVLIRLKAAGVHPADWKYRSGMYKQFMPLQFPWTRDWRARELSKPLVQTSRH